MEQVVHFMVAFYLKWKCFKIKGIFLNDFFPLRVAKIACNISITAKNVRQICWKHENWILLDQKRIAVAVLRHVLITLI